MEYSKTVPERIDINGDFFFSFCRQCKCERKHFVYFLVHNQKDNQVKFASICHYCWNSCYEYNEINDQLNLSPPHQVFWVGYVTSIYHWNEFVTNSQVPTEELPEYYPIIDKDTFKGM